MSGTDTSVKFHVDLTDGAKPIEQHELFYNSAARTLIERVWPGVGSPLSFPTGDNPGQGTTARKRKAAKITRWMIPWRTVVRPVPRG